MMKLAFWSLQTALYQILKAQGIAIFEEAPTGNNFPYVTLGDDTGNNWETKTNHGQEITHTLHVWSRGKSSKECKNLMDTVTQIITSNPLNLAGFNVCDTRLEFAEVLQDFEDIKHGILRFRFKVSQE